MTEDRFALKRRTHTFSVRLNDTEHRLFLTAQELAREHNTEDAGRVVRRALRAWAEQVVAEYGATPSGGRTHPSGGENESGHLEILGEYDGGNRDLDNADALRDAHEFVIDYDPD